MEFFYLVLDRLLREQKAGPLRKDGNILVGSVVLNLSLLETRGGVRGLYL